MAKTTKKKPRKKASGEGTRASVPEWAKGLTRLQRRFVEEYTKDCNATRAAKAAGYSVKTASEMGWENLRKPQIAAAVTARLGELSMAADEVLARVTMMARGSLYPFMKFKEDGEWDLDITTPEALAALPTLKNITVDRKIGRTVIDFDDGRATIRSIEDERVKVELHDQMRALELLGRARGMWEKPEKGEENGHEQLKAQLIARLMELPEDEFEEMMPLVHKLQGLLKPKEPGDG
jgi:hypothetical protein